MKKIFYSLLFSTLFFTAASDLKAQSRPGTVDLFCEFFDSVQTKWNMTATAAPITNTAFWEREDMITKNNSLGAAWDTTGNTFNQAVPNSRSTSFLTTPNIYIDTFTAVNLSFDHICYIASLDDATVEYSFDNGITWTRVPASAYTGPSGYVSLSGEVKFSKLSQPTLWEPGNDSIVWTPAVVAANNAWVREDFDLSALVAGRPLGADSIMLRLGLYDDPGSPVGREGLHIWYVDNFCLAGGNCDLIPPIIDLYPEPPNTPINYPSRYTDRVYLNGPWIFDAEITDNRGQVDTAYVAYYVKREDPMNPGVFTTIITDTIGMTRFAGADFRGIINRNLPNGEVISPRDSVYWKVEALDGSACINSASDPTSGYDAFQVFPSLPESCSTQPVYQYPYVEDFEASTFNPPSRNVIGGDWNNITGDFHNWWLNSGPSSAAGQFRITTDIPGGGNYLYVESTRPAGGTYKDSSAFVTTPCFDFTDLPNGLVRFYLNTNTADVTDSVRIDIYDPTPLPNFPNGKFVNNVIPAVKGNKGDVWLPYEFSTFPYRNFVTQIRFVGFVRNDAGTSDMGLDSFKIIPAALIDARVNSAEIAPFVPSGPKASEDSMRINVQNLGVSNINTLNIGYEIYDETAQNVIVPGIRTEAWNGTIAPGENRTITFRAPGNTYPVPLGKYVVKAWINFASDNIPANDTTFTNARGLLCNDGAKYMDDFDGDTLWTVFLEGDTLTNQWELGTPNFNFTYSAYTEPNSWDILLNRGYTGTGNTVRLLSPFFDFSAVDSVILSFINNRDIDTTKDGMFIEYSFDRGITWDSISGIHDPGRIRWYNSFLSSGGFGGTPVFSGSTFCGNMNTWNGFLESELLLPDTFDFEPEALLRFSFFAEDDDDGNDGISIDNVLIYKPEPLDLQVQHYLTPTSRCDLTDQQRIETIVKNRGYGTVNSFQMEYTVTHVPTGTVVVKTDNINRTVAHRDTLHILSQSTFDMFVYGDYTIDVKAVLPGDGCQENDVLSKLVENIEGCSLQFYIETSERLNVQGSCDSTVWRFNYTSGGRDYEVSQAYNWPANPINDVVTEDTIRDLFVCIKNDANVRFELNDRDTLIERYSFIAFNGENDTIVRNSIGGGPDSQPQIFQWNCPPERSATPVQIYVDRTIDVQGNSQDLIQLPVSKNYFIEARILNNGLDSLDSLHSYMVIDNIDTTFRNIRLDPELKYNRSFFQEYGNHFFNSGPHTIKVWTELPNGQLDLLKRDDTIMRPFNVIDTLVIDFDDPNNPGRDTLDPNRAIICDNFEAFGDSIIGWIASDPVTLSQENVGFQQGVPNSPNINTAVSGSNVWGLRLDSNYENFESAMLLSPFFGMEKDTCYKISFMHNYYITDSLHDGITTQLLLPGYTSDDYDDEDAWMTIGDALGDTTSNFNQRGWFTTQHILAIPNNAQNSGWTGISGGWKLAENVIRSDETYFAAIRWRFESDAVNRSEGWAIDDFCIEKRAANCNVVGLSEALFDKSNLYLGQNIPNPASYSTTIPYYIPKAGEVQFEVINILGQPIYQEKANRPPGDGILELDLSSVAKGVYYYTMTFDGKRITNKMVISK